MTKEELAALIAVKIGELMDVTESVVVSGEADTVGVMFADGTQYFVEVQNV